MKVYSVMLAIVFSFPTSIFSQVQFIPHSIFVDDPRGVYAADVDGDGDIDILSAAGGGGQSEFGEIAWYENVGNKNFTHHTILKGLFGGEGVYAADIDGDGDMDVLSASVFDNRIAWYENVGNKNFITHDIRSYQDYPNCPLGARGVYAADVDDDGDMDVLSASTDDDKISWYENDGDQNFTERIITTNADYAWSVYAADVDNDGDMDVLSASNGDDKVAWYQNDGKQNFTEHIITTNADCANSVYATDVDGDGDIDVLSASFHDSKIAWYENNGNEIFTPHTITEGEIIAFSVYAADIDGDGDIDVVSNGVEWYENGGNENFTTYPIGDGGRTVYAADVDGDGDMDVLSDKIIWFENLSPYISVEFDIKPQSCPNPLNVKDKGVIPVAILGTGNFDVLKVDQATILFEGVAPIRWAIEDVSRPVAGGEPCDCTTDGPDGFADLTLKFDAQELIAALGSVKNGDELVLTITGNLINGTPIKGSDCVIIKAKGNLSKSLIGDLSQLSEEYALYENFPNPFTLNTTIQFAVPVQSFIKLEIYNSLGEKVTTLVSEELEAGTYTSNWNAQNLTSGYYFYRIEASYPSAGSVKLFQQVKKMTLKR